MCQDRMTDRIHGLFVLFPSSRRTCRKRRGSKFRNSSGTTTFWFTVTRMTTPPKRRTPKPTWPPRLTATVDTTLSPKLSRLYRAARSFPCIKCISFWTFLVDVDVLRTCARSKKCTSMRKSNEQNSYTRLPLFIRACSIYCCGKPSPASTFEYCFLLLPCRLFGFVRCTFFLYFCWLHFSLSSPRANLSWYVVKATECKSWTRLLRPCCTPRDRNCSSTCC